MPKDANERAKIGDNSGDDEDDFLDTSKKKMAKAHDKRLNAFFERIERLEEEKKGVADDIKDVYAEAKAVGYDAKIMRMIHKLRKMKPDDRREMEMLIETYKEAIGLA